MSIPVTITTAKIYCKTDKGRTLQLEGEIQALMSLTVAKNIPPQSEEQSIDNIVYPWTVLSANFEFADAQGNCWQINSRFSSELLIRAMMDFSNISKATVWQDLSIEEQQNFQQNIVVQDVWFSSDDRFVRPLIVGNEIKEVQFKYFAVSFDIAILPCKTGHYREVYARTTSPILDIEATKIPSIYFPLNWKYFLVNSYSSDNDSSDFPIPFVVKRINRTAETQPNVVLL